MAKILVVDDDANTNEGVAEYLSSLGHTVRVAFDGEQALAAFAAQSPELVVLDIMLPKLSGLCVLRAMREESDAPVIMLTALESEQIQVESFDCRADDYMTKPFSLVLLGRRVGALLRRQGPPEAPELVRFGAATVDFFGYAAWDASGTIDLTPKEISLLRLLTTHRGQVLTRVQILDTLWGDDAAILDRTIDTHVSNLRKKLQLDCLTTIKGVGYKLEVTA